MPAPSSVPEFLDLVRRSGLIPETKLDEVVDRYRTANTLPQTVDQIASLLVRESLLTFFQAKQLKLGRYKRFTIGSKYRLLELIGAGGMGAVYLCEHTLMARLVALKVLPVEKLEDKSNEERFYREARAVAALDHPNIVRAYDIDHYEKLHFLVMEYVDGSSLQEIVARYVMDRRQFDPIRAAHCIAQSAIGMQHGHELGMVHRDIKPGNILVDRTGVIKVLDMGLARFFNKQQDSVTEKYDDKCVLGTADYLAPEQAVSNMVDIRADIYALGGTMYFLLTGQTPYPDGTIAAKLVAHQTREPRPVDTFRSDVPPGILAVLKRMLAKEPDDRYQEPIEVAEALAEWADHPITPPPPREMPVHCPLVQALATPPSSSTGSHPPLARAIFGSGRGTYSGAGNSGATPSSKGSSIFNLPSRSNYRGGGTGSNPRFRSDNMPVPMGGPVSTGRASASPTAPLPSRADAGATGNSASSGNAPGTNTVVVVQGNRTGLYIIIGVLFALLFAVGAITAYYIGRENKHGPGMGSSDYSTLRPDITKGAIATGFLESIDPGAVVETQFKVASINKSSSVQLNSSGGPQEKGNFSVHILPSAWQAAGKTKDQVAAEFEGKTIRVRGKLARDTKSETSWIEAASLEQILDVSAPR